MDVRINDASALGALVFGAYWYRLQFIKCQVLDGIDH